jgi:hypothetical protein
VVVGGEEVRGNPMETKGHRHQWFAQTALVVLVRFTVPNRR